MRRSEEGKFDLARPPKQREEARIINFKIFFQNFIIADEWSFMVLWDFNEHENFDDSRERSREIAREKKLLRSPLKFYLRPRRWALSFACVLSKSETNYEYASEAMRNVSKFDQVFIRF